MASNEGHTKGCLSKKNISVSRFEELRPSFGGVNEVKEY
jgi:hypothetical protein